jgi:hypothetical protein
VILLYLDGISTMRMKLSLASKCHSMSKIGRSVSFDLTEILRLLTELTEVSTVRYFANLNLTV